MKKFIDNIIKQLAYKHPDLWLKINEDIFILVDAHKKDQMKKTKETINKFYNKDFIK